MKIIYQFILNLFIIFKLKKNINKSFFNGEIGEDPKNYFILFY